MRVIAGRARGLKLTSPVGMQTRPTGDRVKEALFSIIASQKEIMGARILDICAGTGSLGIEALSRGADSCCFIEQNRLAFDVLQKNLFRTGLISQAYCLELDAIKALNHLAAKGYVFDIVFFDPPYSSRLYMSVPEVLSSMSLLSERSLLAVECSSRMPLTEYLGSLIKIDRRVYGDTALEFYQKE